MPQRLYNHLFCLSKQQKHIICSLTPHKHIISADGLVKILVAVAILSAAFSISEIWDILKENADSAEVQSTVLQSLVEPGIIIAILLLNAAVGVWQDLSARSSLESLEKMQPRLATVLRRQRDNSSSTTTSSEWIIDYDATKLVPGDVIKVRVGDYIPADARLGSLTSSTMYVDESSLTGESVSVGKLSGDEGLVDIENNGEGKSVPIQLQSMMLFSGSLATRGSGVAVVVRTGTGTQIGKIQSTLAEAQVEGEERKTPLGVQLDEFGTQLSYIIGGICLAVWLASIPRFSDAAFNTWIEGAVYYAKVGVALGVAAIPEGLPAVITLCLSLGTRRMAEKNVIVRKLPSVETLGCTSVICTDKTGTLTTNQMTAVSFVTLEGGGDSINVVEHEVMGSSYNPVGYVEGISRDETLSLPNGAVSEACLIMALCNDARLIGVDGNEEGTTSQFIIEGEPTEASLLALLEKLGPESAGEGSLKPSQLASEHRLHVASSWNRYATLEFDRKRKSMSVLCSRIDSDSEEKLLVKGAPNMLLKRCTHAKLRDGSVIPLTSDLRDKIESTIRSIGNRALRCIGLAVKEGESLEPQLRKEGGSYTELLKDSSKYETFETDLTFVGLVAIKDPPRDGVAESIDECKQAGIRVIMITGDAKQTAEAIARDVHIFTDQDVSCPAFEGREFFALPDSQQLEVLKSGNLVICRAEPADKQRLVKMLQSLNEIPAMTGDGVNDAPALQQADIGVAMGISGTDVAKEAADMVLVDDNFSTIVDAVEEGRAIYANMQSFINFLITCNIGEVIGVFLATILGFPQLLTPLHLLWVNLVTDGPPATALGFNPPDPNLMNRKPRSSEEEIMTSENLLRYSIAGLYIGIATVGVYASYFLDHGVSFQELQSWSTCTDSCSIYADLAAPQTLALSTLVTVELLKALCSVSIDSSILTVGPQKNPWLLLGVSVPFAFNLAIIYIPALEQSFGLVPLDVNDWLKVLAWSLPIVIIDEALKYAFKKDKS
jgi:Ca2+-transporting ATPase